MLLIGYGQVSPRSPRDEQEMELRAAGCRRLFFDDKFDSDQKALTEVIELLGHQRESWPRLLIVCSLDRLASSITRLIEISSRLREHRILLQPLHEKWSERASEFFFHFTENLADFRKENAADKSQRGILVAEKRGRQTGRRPALTQVKLEKAIKEIEAGSVIANVAKNASVSVPTLYRYLAAYRRGNKGR